MLGWTPYEYYTSSPYEFFAATEGYFIRREHEEKALRLGFYRVHQSLVKDPLRIEEFWPIFTDKASSKREGIKIADRAWWDKMKSIHPKEIKKN